jgi:hypothetical protein
VQREALAESVERTIRISVLDTGRSGYEKAPGAPGSVPCTSVTRESEKVIA